MARSGAITLSDVLEPVLTIACEPCARRGVYSVRRLLNKHGDARLPDILNYLSRECPKQGNPHRKANRALHCVALDGPPTPRGER
jgi:hypothetical protein